MPDWKKRDALTAAQARVEELERALAWLHEHRAEFFPGGPDDSYVEWNVDNEIGRWETVYHDGTPASILAAVEKAMKG